MLSSSLALFDLLWDFSFSYLFNLDNSIIMYLRWMNGLAFLILLVSITQIAPVWIQTYIVRLWELYIFLGMYLFYLKFFRQSLISITSYFISFVCLSYKIFFYLMFYFCY